jgi:hypothetical protein
MHSVKTGVSTNYGFFYPLYIQYIIEHMDELTELYKESLIKINSKCDGIAERSKFIYGGILVAGWLCEEVFEKIGLPCRSREEVEKIVNHYFKECVIGDPVELE